MFTKPGEATMEGVLGHRPAHRHAPGDPHEPSTWTTAVPADSAVDDVMTRMARKEVMNHVRREPGWWMATDGKWYRPEQHPDYGQRSDTNGTSPGPGWWMASDERWYPPEQHPDYVAPSPTPTLTTTATAVPPAGAAAEAVPAFRTDPTAINGTATNGAAASSPAVSEDALDKVRRLGGLLDAGRLSDREFQQMRKEILGLS
jgi:hypothetical protein